MYVCISDIGLDGWLFNDVASEVLLIQFRKHNVMQQTQIGCCSNCSRYLVSSQMSCLSHSQNVRIGEEVVMAYLS
jgi:hypothetical protein